MSLSKNKKIDIINAAIKRINNCSDGMCRAIIKSIFNEISWKVNAFDILESEFPQFTRADYCEYYDINITDSIKYDAYWDSLNEEGKQRRIKFLEHLKTTV